MLNKYFGSFSSGRLLRLQYLGYTLLMAALFIGFVFATILMIGAAETLMGGDLADAQAGRFREIGFVGLPR